MNYLRLAVTDRCNLRCQYCMPAEGIPLNGRDHILHFEEMEQLIQIFQDLGVNKLRITGGEPFVRKGLLEFLKRVNKFEGINSINITTNAVFIGDIISDLEQLKIGSLNISLDSLQKDRFFKITRRDEFEIVMENIDKALKSTIPVKLNMVVLAGINDDEILSFTRLAKDNLVEVRFIEQMPFSGGPASESIISADQILDILRQQYPLLYEQNLPNSTARVFYNPGYKGTIGIIAGYSRTFCSSCTRLRITPEGMLKTCLYDRGAVNLKEMLRAGKTDLQIKDAIIMAVQNRAKDGFESQERSSQDYNVSMAQIGG
ncbi:MAG: GTP 3',8-cyclase MoaA [Bacteroidetes bacterium]|nr:GTP 3',8-cyclase MoaA [Bacteroidota bacterium]